MLDRFVAGELDGVKKKLKESFFRYRALQKELSEAEVDGEKRIRELSFLQFELDEIEKAKLVAGEEEERRTACCHTALSLRAGARRGLAVPPRNRRHPRSGGKQWKGFPFTPRHGMDVAGVLAYAEECREKIERYENYDQYIENLEKKCKKEEEELKNLLAGKLLLLPRYKLCLLNLVQLKLQKVTISI